MTYFFLGLAFFAGLVLLGRWLVTVDPKVLAGILRGLIIVFGLLGILYLYGSGRGVLAAVLLPLLLPMLVRWRAMRRMARAWGGPSPGQASEARTRYLNMTLDHDTGEMSGEVIDGAFAGRRLADLSLDEHLALYRECRAGDEQSARVLEAYLDRAHGAEWRERAGVGAGDGGGPGGGFHSGAMTREEALEILGLKRGAGAGEIKAAHRRLMATAHPDRGGSTYLASKINQAKDVLLKK
ncbi:MAG: molecular chaperone DnaJ [Alphaproteobacteria bacterium]